MFFRAKRALSRAWFNLNCRAVFKSSPLSCTDDGLVLVSMLCHGEVVMYLVATKSFCHRLGKTPQVVVLNDGSLTAADLATLHAHIPDIRIVSFSDVPPDQCPKRNCWERLLLISDLVIDSYVIQIDSDTVTAGAIEEVIECIAQNRSFTLMGDRSHPQVESMQDASSRAKSNPGSTVQEICERSFDQLAECQSLRYVRGNAGFTGFAKGSIDREKIVHMSDLMRQISKDKWDDWGSEQVTSNLLIANSPAACVLQFPKYLSYWARPDVAYSEASFIHFIGPHRFSNGVYVKTARKILAEL